MLRIITDTGSDIPYLAAGALGLELVELDIQFEEFPYDYRNDTDYSVFFQLLAQSKKLPTTSQVTPGQYLELFNDAEEKGDELLVLTLASGMSGTHSSAVIAQEMSGYAGITVVDTRQASITQRMLAEYAVKLRDEGQSRAAIAETIENICSSFRLIVMLDTLKYLRKGGRVPAPMAILGEALGMKPVVAVWEAKVESLAKARGIEAGKQALWTQFEKDGYDETWPVYFGYSHDRARGEAFMQETKEKYGLQTCHLFPVGGVIGTHAGPGGIAMGYVKKR